MFISELLEDIDSYGDDLGERAYYETMADFADPYATNADWRFVCNLCARETDDLPDGCPDHAPVDVPGLARSECWKADGRQHRPYWVLNGDHAGYGVPCPDCLAAPYREAEALARQCRHWRWRKWRIMRKIVWAAYKMGVTPGIGGFEIGDGHHCTYLPRFWGRRTYILGIRITRRDTSDPWS